MSYYDSDGVWTRREQLKAHIQLLMLLVKGDITHEQFDKAARTVTEMFIAYREESDE